MTRFITRLLLNTTTTKRSSGPAFRRSYTSLSFSTSRSPLVPTDLPLLRLRYLTAASLRLLTPAHSTAVRSFATWQTSSSLPNLSNQPPEDDGGWPWIIVLDEPEGNPTKDEIIDSYVKTLATVVGSLQEAREKMYIVSTRRFFAFGACISKKIADRIRDLPRVCVVEPDSGNGFLDHWLIVLDDPEGNPTRDEIIDNYIKTLAAVVGSEEEARKKIYIVSTRHYFAFAANISREIAKKLIDQPGVVFVGTDSMLEQKFCGGEPFINGQAVPYDPKYHEEWFRMRALRRAELVRRRRGEWVRRRRENELSQVEPRSSLSHVFGVGY